MKTKSGFTLMNREEFKTWLDRQDISRKITMIQNHHTYLPDYTNFNGDNHFSKVLGMRSHHIFVNRWSEIGQHITTFPDGKVMIGGRGFDRAPAGIKGNNDFAICIENLGNFDKGKDKMTKEHEKTIVHVNACLNLKFGLFPSTDNNVYHHWFDLRTTSRTNGSGITKSCPGTGFFGGNKVKDCAKNFIPLVVKAIKKFPNYAATFNDHSAEEPIGQAMVVRCNRLNVRTGPSARKKKLESLERGTIVNVFEKKGRWTRISRNSYWVSSFYLRKMKMGIVIDEDPKGLNVRTGPGGRYRKLSSLLKGTEVTIFEEDNNWYRIDYLDKWVYGKYVEVIS